MLKALVGALLAGSITISSGWSAQWQALQPRPPWNSKAPHLKLHCCVPHPSSENREQAILRSVRNGDLRGPVDFPPSLSAARRAGVHAGANKLGLVHGSIGFGSQRHVSVCISAVPARLERLERFLEDRCQKDDRSLVAKWMQSVQICRQAPCSSLLQQVVHILLGTGTEEAEPERTKVRARGKGVEARSGAGDGAVSVITGAPGTGKSKLLVEIARSRAEQGEQVLVCAPTHSSTASLAFALAGEVRLNTQLERQPVGHGCITVAALDSLTTEPDRRFDLIVLDDAHEACTPAVLLALLQLRQALSSTDSASLSTGEHRPLLILAGDERQLHPPTLHVSESAELESSLFEELVLRTCGPGGPEHFSRWAGGVSAPSLGAGEKPRSKTVGRQRTFRRGKLASVHKGEVAGAARATDNIITTARRLLEPQPQLYSADAQAQLVSNAIEAQSRSAVATGGISGRRLVVQYDLPPALVAFPSAAFYGGQIRSGNESQYGKDIQGPSQMRAQHSVSTTEGLGFRFIRPGACFEALDTSKAGMQETKAEDGLGREWVNEGEAGLAVNVLQQVLADEEGGGGYAACDVAVLTTSRAQTTLLCTMIGNWCAVEELRGDGDGGERREDVDGGVDDERDGVVVTHTPSVLAHLSRKRKVLLLVTVRSNRQSEVGSVLGDQRWLNSALWLPQDLLILIGDSDTLAANPWWNALWKWTKVVGSSGRPEPARRLVDRDGQLR